MLRAVTPSFDHLLTLVTLVRNGGDAAATAHELGISQPSISKRLSMFQHRVTILPTPWLTRTGHVWRLTADGEKVFPAVQEVVRRYRQLLDAPAVAVGPTVSVGCGQTGAAVRVQVAAIAFRRRFPDVRLRVRTLRSRQRVEEVSGGGLDLAEVSHGPIAVRRIAGRRMATWELPAEPLVAVAAADTEWGKRLAKHRKDNPLRPADLLALRAPWLLPEPSAPARAVIDRGMQEAGEPEVALEAGGWAVLCDYAAAGLGVAVVSQAGVGDSGLVGRPLDTAAFAPLRTWVIARPVGRDRADLSPEAEAFRQLLLKAG